MYNVDVATYRNNCMKVESVFPGYKGTYEKADNRRCVLVLRI